MTRGRIRACIALLLSALIIQNVDAQVPTPEQMDLLRSMSAEDRAALMEQLGVSPDAIMGDSGSTGEQAERPESAANARQTADGAARVPPADYSLKPGDSILIDVAIRRETPARVVPSAQPGVPPTTIPGEPAPELTAEERRLADEMVNLIRARNPYQLDNSGQLVLPGFAPIMLAGLDDEQATHRLSLLPAFANMDVKVIRFPVRKAGPAALKPFGYDLFKTSTSRFAPFADAPVPADYIVGAGDQIIVQLYGTQSRNHSLLVGRDGRINFPGIGPIDVAGRDFERVATDIEQRVAAQLPGVRASIGIGNTRSISVFVVGEVQRAGSFTVSGLSTITSALYAAGGLKPIGSLRDVQLKRQGAVVRRLDLYDLLLRGDTSDDARLQPGDVIFVPPVGPTAAIDGEVQRPAIYELRGETSIDDAVRMAGGLTAEADPARAALVRVRSERGREVVNVPLDDAAGRSTTLRNGDSLRILRLRPTMDAGVTVTGHVHRPAQVAWRKGLRLTDVISTVDELKPDADIHYLLIRRELPPDRRIAAVSADLAAALRDPTSAANITLEPRDTVIIFDQETGRNELIQPLLQEMRRQARIDRPTEVVRIDGRVKAKGEYPLEPGMRVSDLLRAGGGLQDAAFGSTAELVRYRYDTKGRQTDLIDIDLAAVLRGDESADILLASYDFLIIKELPEWSDQESITLTGEVRFPGIYPLRRGETLKSVLARAGGLTSLAFPEGSIFLRAELKEREQAQIDRLAERLQSDLAAAALRGAQASQSSAGEALAVGQQLLNQLKETESVGRLVIDLKSVLAAKVGDDADIMLRHSDHLMIPKAKQEVTVIGEVQNPTSHFFRPTLTRDDYLNLSGGLTRKADRSRVYIVRADGSVISGDNSGWFRRSAQVGIRPGDTIVAPLDTERMPALPLWQAVTGIIYNLAIAAAAVNSF